VHVAGQRLTVFVFGLAWLASGDARGDEVTLERRRSVRAGDVAEVEIDGKKASWADLSRPREPGSVELRWRVRLDADGGVEFPVCAGRGTVTVDGNLVRAPDPAPLVTPLSAGEHVLSVRLTVSGYERRIACGTPLRVGVIETTDATSGGLARLAFASPHAGGGRAVVFLPPGHDLARPAALLVMPHPWNGSTWTYAAYAELLDEAARRDVVLLFPSGLGNSLYTAPAEDEVLRAIDAIAVRVAVDPARVSIAGASMGGAGATTIGLHHPDRFAGVTSWFGDSRYDLATYVRPILRDEAGAHAVNAADVADNARWVPVWLIHGEDDRVSPIAQSEILARELASRGFAVRFDRAPGFGHSGALVAKYARDVVARASEARAPRSPARVTYRSVRTEDRGAYGVAIERDGGGDAFVDIERTDDGAVHVHRADRVRAITLAAGALGAKEGAAPVVVDPAAGQVRVRWAR
jgi:pimeloyl-ACP methyl ester carboxylesterase